MTALISAELLRLRTVRSPRYIALGVLAFVALLGLVPLVDANAAPHTADELADGLRALALAGVLIGATFAASNTGTEFKRGAAALTYLAHPRRGRVTTARALAYAGLTFAFTAVAAGVVIATGLVVAADQDMNAGLSAADAAQIVIAAGFGGAVIGAAGALLGIVTRNPTVATGAIVGWNLGESLLQIAGIGPYLPFGLVGSLMGSSDGLPLAAALALLFAYLAAFAVIVRVWALPRDVT